MISITQLLSYGSALAIAAIIPGPGMTAVVARTLNGGVVMGFALLSGLILGDILYLSFAIFGLVLVADHLAIIFNVIYWGAALYLLWLAYSLWRQDIQPLKTSDSISTKQFAIIGASGLMITLSNPKTIAFYMAILPLVISLNEITITIWSTILIPITLSILLLVGMVFILGAKKASQFLSSRRSQRIIFRGTALMMAAAAIGMLLKTQ
ncbi:LysE family translocator [Providencia vermicola]|uniref:LysE family translocator n=1 Tax=Providencia stuartii TaxID=588 RepID=A0AAI9I1E8_PROST|nr:MULTISPECIES: LysE family translocator [Providencia]ELR5044248.1 LysE family translocator [Providencia rettgeri]ELR5036524.1 LysE family translocator [Providencia stuartii]ELR5291779.1 LysE family translocator [Providencia stuartii]MBG5921032.1 LysE family translocator [Providencia stuartii]MCK1144482.1 LysE family translocator [Providencia stuartii]